MTTKKKLIAVLLAVVLALGFAACGKTATDIKNEIAYSLNGNVVGEIGKIYSTSWFTFVIESIEQVDKYKGYKPADGYVLYDVIISEKNTFPEPIGMGTFDFFMDSDSFLDYEWPLDPFDDSMMPLEFYLDVDETARYHMVFEVPATASKLKLIYVEINEEGVEYATFTINVN